MSEEEDRGSRWKISAGGTRQMEESETQMRSVRTNKEKKRERDLRKSLKDERGKVPGHLFPLSISLLANPKCALAVSFFLLSHYPCLSVHGLLGETGDGGS